MANEHRIQWLVPLLLMLVGLAFGLAGYPLLDPDEGRNAEVAREMAASNDYILPRLNGLPYLDKPIIFFGAAAVSMEIFGPTVFAARVTPFVFTLLTILLVGWFGKRLYGPVGGWTAAIATGTMPLTLAFARTVIFDSALTFFITATLVSLFIGLDAEDTVAGRTTTQKWIPAAFGFMAFGVLTKGPVAIIIPLLVAIPFGVFRARWKRLLDPMGWLLLVAIVLPWVVAVSRQVPDFVRYVVYTESVGRLFTDELRRTGPLWYFIPIFAAGALPWSFVALFGWKSNGESLTTRFRKDGRITFFLLWIALPLIFFSLSQSKRPQYVLPLLPAVGLLVTHLWSTAPSKLPGARATALALLPIAVLLGMASVVVDGLLDVSPAIAAAIPRLSLILSLVTGVAAIGLWLWHDRRAVVMTMLSLPAAGIALGSPTLMRAIGEDRSTFHAATIIKLHVEDATEIVAVDAYPLSLPFYLGKTFTLSTTDGSELTSNYLVRSLDRFREEFNTILRPADWWLDALANCNTPRIFIARNDDQRVRTVLASRLPLIVEMKRASAYGPCKTEALAQTSAPTGPTSGSE